MARREEEELVSRVKVGDCVTKIGSPEVDRLLYDCQFRKLKSISTGFTRINDPKEDDTLDGECRKLSAHCSSCPKDNTVVGADDLISQLPDDILRLIISSLTIREGVATSSLSTRWRYLWTASFSTLNFDVPGKLGYDYTASMLQSKGKLFLIEERSNFVRWVDQVLGLFRRPSLCALRVYFGFGLNSKFQSRIDGWIQSATAREVIDIELDFSDLRNDPYIPDFPYDFPAQQVTSSLKHLHLKSCILRLSPNFTDCMSLVTLSLSNVRVDQSTLDLILSKCPLLQFLSMESCRYTLLGPLRFGGPSSCLLKHLHIQAHIQAGVDNMEIELHDVTLLSFELVDVGCKLSIVNAPHLARLVLGTAVPIEVLSNLPRLETLFLSEHLEESIMPKSFVFDSLKRLVFIAQGGTTNLLRVVSLLEDCRFLQELEIDMGITEEGKTIPHTDTMMRRLTTGRPHNNLKEIEIYGFHALTERIELAKYLLKNALVLQKMQIYTASKVYDGNGKWSFYEATMKQPIPLKEVCEMLQTVARTSTELELFSSPNL